MTVFESLWSFPWIPAFAGMTFVSGDLCGVVAWCEAFNEIPRSRLRLVVE
jgi:hypothetical protein